MHAVFMISGVRKFVDEFFDWLDCRLYAMPFKNPTLLPHGPKDASGNLLAQGVIPVTARVRYGIYGTYELCFPEEHKDIVLTTLRFHERNFYGDKYQDEPLLNAKNKVKNFLGKMEIDAFRKLIGCEPIPEFNSSQALQIPEDITQNIRIIPVGVRYDEKEWIAPNGIIHERI